MEADMEGKKERSSAIIHALSGGMIQAWFARR